MALAPIKDHTKAKMRHGFVTRKAEDRGPPPQSPIPETSMLQKMVGVRHRPLAWRKRELEWILPL